MENVEKKWYVVNTYSGHENKVKEKLEMRAESMDMQDYIYRVVVPEQTEIEVKDGVEKENLNKSPFELSGGEKETPNKAIYFDSDESFSDFCLNTEIVHHNEEGSCPYYSFDFTEAYKEAVKDEHTYFYIAKRWIYCFSNIFFDFGI